MKRSLDPFPPKDGGWGWFVVLGAGITSLLGGGFIRTFSIIFEEIREKFGSSASATAWVYSLNVTMTLFSGPLSTMLSTRFSVRKVGMVGSFLMFIGFLASAFAPSLPYMYLAHAIIGVGQGFIFTPKLLMIAQWFDKRRSRATSVALMMDGFGALAMAPLLQFLLDHYGYSGTMVIVSAVMANNYVAAALFRKPDELDFNSASDVIKHISEVEDGIDDTTKVRIELKENIIENEEDIPIKRGNDDILLETEDAVLAPDSQSQEVQAKDCSLKVRKYFDYKLLQNGQYLTFCLLMMCASICMSMCNTHIAGLAEESGLTISQISLLIGSMGGTSIASKFLSGFLFDSLKVRKIRIHLFSCFGWLIGISFLISHWIHSVVGFYMLWLTYACAVAVFTTQESIILADIVGKKSFTSALGLNRFFRGIGCLIGPTVGGFLKDYTEVYDYTFIFGGLCLLVSVTLFEFSVIVQCRKNKS